MQRNKTRRNNNNHGRASEHITQHDNIHTTLYKNGSTRDDLLFTLHMLRLVHIDYTSFKKVLVQKGCKIIIS
jgi:hypothetical protein